MFIASVLDGAIEVPKKPAATGAATPKESSRTTSVVVGMHSWTIYKRAMSQGGAVRCLRGPRLMPTPAVWYFGGSGGNGSVVECDLAKVEVAGSNPVSRSKFSMRHIRLASIGSRCCRTLQVR